MRIKLKKVHAQCAAVAAALLTFVAHADAVNPAVTKVKDKFMITKQDALQWNKWKAAGGPTYAGSPGGVRYANFLESTAQELGLVDLDFVDVPYLRYVVNDYPNPNAHIYGTGSEIEKLVVDGVPVPVVAGYGMTSGFTPPGGVTAPLIYYDPANPPTAAQIKGKILVAKTVPYPAPVPNSNGPYAYSSSVLSSYTETDYIYRSPGKWLDPYKPIPANLSSSQWGRWVWSQLDGFAQTAIKGGAAGMVVVYDLSPAMAFGLTQRSVYSTSGSGATTVYANVPTLTLDRVNGAKIVADAQAGKSANLTLLASFEVSHGREIIGYLPGKNYGTASDEQILIATHQDAMSLIEENGGIGMLGILNYFSHIPQSERPRTLVFWFDNRHFMPGGEGAWSQYDYYNIHPEKQAPIVATVALEHMGGKATIETGAGGNDYMYSTEKPKNGGVITSYVRLDNTEWFFKQIKQAAEDNGWVRVEAKTSSDLPGIHGGYQSAVKSPLTKGPGLNPPRAGFGLAGDWPGAWTQTFSQLETEAEGEMRGFDPEYFVEQVAGMTQVVGNLMTVDPIVIDLSWGDIRSGLQCAIKAICTSVPPTGLLPDSQFVYPATASYNRQMLVDEYLDMTDLLEKGKYNKVKKALKKLQADITSYVAEPNRTALNLLITNQISKLPASSD